MTSRALRSVGSLRDRLLDWIARGARAASSGWEKYDGNPVLRASELGTLFDVSVLRKEDGIFRMYFSWRPRKSIGLCESTDGVSWSDPVIVLGPNEETGWEDQVNRPAILEHDGIYHLWYTGQASKRSSIGYAASRDGRTFERRSQDPVLRSGQSWEKVAVMTPHVVWDEDAEAFRMWYSGGENFEPDAIGHATSADGVTWAKSPENPIFRPAPHNRWERAKVTAPQVVHHGDWYYLFYIGFRDPHHAQIGLARSRDGIGDWQRHAANPIVRPGRRGEWDCDSCYKPFALFVDDQRWLLWYNGRKQKTEQIGVAIHEGDGLFGGDKDG